MGQGTQRDEAPEVLCQRAMQGYAQEEGGEARSNICGEDCEVQRGAEAMRNGAQSSSPGGDSAPSPEAPEQTGATETGGSSSSSGSRGARGDQAAAPNVNGLDTNLHHFHQFANFATLPAGEFTKVRRWKKTCLFGKVEKYLWTPVGQTEEVLRVVKNMDTRAVDECRRLPANDRIAWADGMVSPEDAMNEIGVYNFLEQQEGRCPYVLQMHGSFINETRTWLVLENCEGDLFDWVEHQRDAGLLDQQQIKRYVWQILRAVHFLHSHNVGHRDISLENLLLRNGEVRLMDFGQAVLLRAPDGTEYHYFRTSGKDYYRAPECYIPSSQTCPGLRAQAMCPQGWSPGREVQVMGGGYLCLVSFPDSAVPGQYSVASFRGYTVGPVDVFAMGVAFFILHAQVQPWSQALMAIGNFRFVYHNGIKALLESESFNKPLSDEASELLTGMLHVYAAYRWTVQQCLVLESAWFADLQAEGA